MEIKNDYFKWIPSVSSSSANTEAEGEEEESLTSAAILRPGSTLYSLLAFLIVRTSPCRLLNPASVKENRTEQNSRVEVMSQEKRRRK